MNGLLKFWNKIKGSLFIIFLSTSFLLLLIYFGAKFFFKPFFYDHKNFFHDLFAISLAILSPGVFAAILKYFQFLGVFETEINKIISSSPFETTLQKTINQTVYSVDFLSRQKDLEKIWRNSTICLFQAHFPNISEKVEAKLTNDLFKSDILSYYYKNYQVKIYVSFKDEKYLDIKEISTYSIVRPTAEEFNFEFEYSIPKIEGDNLTKISIEEIKIDGKSIELKTGKENPDTKEIVDLSFKYSASGSKEYDVYHSIHLIYPIDVDNEYTFRCERIIEDSTAELYIDDKITSNFVPLMNEKLETIKINGGEIRSIRGILLPNNGFRTYFYKK